MKECQSGKQLFRPHLFLLQEDADEPKNPDKKYKLNIIIPTGKEKYKCELDRNGSIVESGRQRIPNHPYPEKEKPIVITLTYKEDTSDEQYISIEERFCKEEADKIFVEVRVPHEKISALHHHQGGEGSAHYGDADD